MSDQPQNESKQRSQLLNPQIGASPSGAKFSQVVPILNIQVPESGTPVVLTAKIGGSTRSEIPNVKPELAVKREFTESETLRPDNFPSEHKLHNQHIRKSAAANLENIAALKQMQPQANSSQLLNINSSLQRNTNNLLGADLLKSPIGTRRSSFRKQPEFSPGQLYDDLGRKKSVRFTHGQLFTFNVGGTPSPTPEQPKEETPQPHNELKEDDKKALTINKQGLLQIPIVPHSNEEETRNAVESMRKSIAIMQARKSKRTSNTPGPGLQFVGPAPGTMGGDGANKISISHVKEAETGQQITKIQITSKLESSDEEEEIDLPYPYNTLTTHRNNEIQSQIRVVNAMLKRKNPDKKKQTIALRRGANIHNKIFAARLLFMNPELTNVSFDTGTESKSISRSESQKPLDADPSDMGSRLHRKFRDKISYESFLGRKGLWAMAQKSHPQRSFNIDDKKQISEYMTRKRTMADPYKCSPRIQAKWICNRNVIYATVRFLMIQKDITLYGTGESMLDIRKGIKNIRDFMIPYAHLNGEQVEKTNLQIEPDCLMIREESIFRKIWSGVLIILLLYTATIMPFNIALQGDNANDTYSISKIIDTMVDFLFMIDIWVNFNSGILQQDQNVVDYKRSTVSKQYMKSWFFIDILASIPVNFVLDLVLDKGSDSRTNVNISGQRLIRVVRLPRLYRLVRMARLFKILKIFKRSVFFQKVQLLFKLNNAAVRITSFLITVILCVHLSGCLWIIVANLNDYNPDTWVSRLGLADSADSDIYIAAIYWSIQTLLTVGYGDVPAVTIEEQCVAVSWMILGGFFYTFTIGNLTSVLSNQNTRQQMIRDKVQAISQFCKENSIDRQLSVKMRNAVYYISNKNFIWADKQKIFEELTPSIKCEIAMQMHYGIIMKIRFFDDKDHNLIGSVVPLLTPLKTNQNEYIYRKGSHPQSIYFITSGRVSFFLEKKRIAFKDMIEGGYFGDLDIIFKRKRRYSMLSIIPSDFVMMTKQIFEDIIINQYPEIYEEMTLIAVERQRKIQQAKDYALEEYEEMLKKKGEENQTPYKRFKMMSQDGSKYSEQDLYRDHSNTNSNNQPQHSQSLFKKSTQSLKLNDSDQSDEEEKKLTTAEAHEEESPLKNRKARGFSILKSEKTEQSSSSSEGHKAAALKELVQKSRQQKLSLKSLNNSSLKTSLKQNSSVKPSSTSQSAASSGRHLYFEPPKIVIMDSPSASKWGEAHQAPIIEIFKPKYNLRGGVPSTLNEDDEEIISIIKSQRSQIGRLQPEVLQNILKEQQIQDVVHDSDSGKSHSSFDSETDSSKEEGKGNSQSQVHPLILVAQQHTSQRGNQPNARVQAEAEHIDNKQSSGYEKGIVDLESITSEQNTKNNQMSQRIDNLNNQMQHVLSQLGTINQRMTKPTHL